MDPVTIALAAQAGLSAIGKLLGGGAKRKAAKARAAALEQGAQMDLAEAGLAAQMGLEEDERVAASLAVNAASGSGGGLGGSALRVLDDLGRQSRQKARNTVYRGQTSAWARRNDAAVSRAEASNAMGQSILSAGGSLLGGFARTYGKG
ncbi:MAG: hypothetical protein DI570_18925 [Phenylobacterium zucineum]|nr:MAG: hypothetical protein DI570_18925 [Phenylobacterium zucineum]